MGVEWGSGGEVVRTKSFLDMQEHILSLICESSIPTTKNIEKTKAEKVEEGKFQCKDGKRGKGHSPLENI